MRWWREYGVEDPDEPGSAGVSAEQIANVMVEQLERLADLLEVLQTLDPSTQTSYWVKLLQLLVAPGLVEGI